MARAVEYSPQFDVVDLVQRGRTTTIACPVYRSGELQVPTEAGSTVTVYDASGTVVVDGEDVTVTDGVATYEIDGSVTDDLDLGRGWRIDWSPLMPDGVVHTFRAEAGLVLCTPSPVISDQALYARVPALNPRGAAPLNRTVQSYQGPISDAWIRLRNDLDAVDHRVELVVSNTQLREPHLLLTLAFIFADLASRNATHQTQADRYMAQYEAALARAVLKVDTNDDGAADEVKSAKPAVFLM